MSKIAEGLLKEAEQFTSPQSLDYYSALRCCQMVLLSEDSTQDQENKAYDICETINQTFQTFSVTQKVNFSKETLALPEQLIKQYCARLEFSSSYKYKEIPYGQPISTKTIIKKMPTQPYAAAAADYNPQAGSSISLASVDEVDADAISYASELSDIEEDCENSLVISKI